MASGIGGRGSRGRRRPVGVSRAVAKLYAGERSACPHCGRDTITTSDGVCAECWGSKGGQMWRDRTRIRNAYITTIRYSVSSIISYLQKYGDDNTVLVFLGDHQPAAVVSGENGSHDVPITIVAKDRTVLERVSSWGWTDGLKPGPQSPVWRMDSFRDRFLTAFGPQVHG